MKKVVIATVSSILSKVDLNPELYNHECVVVPLDALETVKGLDTHNLNYHPSCWAYFTVREDRGEKEWVLIIKRGLTTYWIPQGNISKVDISSTKELKEGPWLKVFGDYDHFTLSHITNRDDLMNTVEIFDTRQTGLKENHVQETSPTSF